MTDGAGNSRSDPDRASGPTSRWHRIGTVNLGRTGLGIREVFTPVSELSVYCSPSPLATVSPNANYEKQVPTEHTNLSLDACITDSISNAAASAAH
jgi:hypothetical protein